MSRPDGTEGDDGRRMTLVGGLLRAARPKQWAKNVLVFAAPAGASVLDDGWPLIRTVAAFVAFCLVSSGTYYFNDLRDLQSDRAHPKKRYRPIAMGVVPERTAAVGGALMVLAGLAIATAVTPRLTGVLVVYIVITVSYSIWLKHVAVVDIAAVSSGFILRAVAGGIAADVPISRWFLIVASFGSLFIVACKRHAEHLELDEDRGDLRTTLGIYSIAYLRFVWMSAASITVAAYCLWAFEQSDTMTKSHFPWYQLSIVPFVMALLRYALLVELGHGGAPEDVLVNDRSIQVMGFAWALLYAAGVYLGH